MLLSTKSQNKTTVILIFLAVLIHNQHILIRVVTYIIVSDTVVT